DQGAPVDEVRRPVVRQDLRRRRRSARHAGAVPPALHQGIHHQSDADAQGGNRRLPRLRARGARRDCRPADLVRGLLGRVRRDGAAGARDRQLGGQRLRQDPGDQHARRERGPAGAPPLAPGRQAERDGAAPARAGARDRRLRGRRRAGLHLGLRRPHGRHRCRPRADDGRSGAHPRRGAQCGTDLGQSARAAEHLPGGRDRLSHHHRDARHPEEAVAGRPRSARLLPRHGEDVPHRRGAGGIHALITAGRATFFVLLAVEGLLIKVALSRQSTPSAAARRAIFLVPLALALALRAHQALATPDVLDWDETYYLSTAVTAAAGHGLYPYVLGYGPMPIAGGLGYVSYVYALSVRLLGPSIYSLRLMSLLASVLALAGVWRLVKIWYGSGAAWIATGIAAATKLFPLSHNG